MADRLHQPHLRPVSPSPTPKESYNNLSISSSTRQCRARPIQNPWIRERYRSIRGIQPLWGRLSGSRGWPRPTANNSHESLSSAGILGSRSQPIILLMSTNLPTLSTFELGTRNGISPKPALESLVLIKQPQAVTGDTGQLPDCLIRCHVTSYPRWGPVDRPFAGRL